MARIRTIKPEFFTSEDIVLLSPLARLLYIALWCESDKEGRLAWKPRTFKIRYLPADDCDIDALSRELVASGLVKLYGNGLAYIPTFGRHQHINPRESASCLPAPDACSPVTDASARVTDASAPDSDAQGGREGKGREGKDRNSSASADAERDGLDDLSVEQQPRFDRFWVAYPKKRSKGDAVKAWRKIRPSESLVTRMLSALAKAKTSADWKREGGQYIPHPASWLNAAGWDDEGSSVAGMSELDAWMQQTGHAEAMQ